MKRYYAQNCIDILTQEGVDPMPTTLNIMNLLICIEEIAGNKDQQLEETTLQYVRAPQKHDKVKFEAALDEFEAFFERIADCMIRLCSVYKFWHQSALPLILLKYMMYHSRSVRVDLKVHKMMRVLMLDLNKDDEMGSLQSTIGPPKSMVAAFTFKQFTNTINWILNYYQLDTVKLINKISSFRELQYLGDLKGIFLEACSMMLTGDKIAPHCEKFFSSFEDKDILRKNFKLLHTWLIETVMGMEVGSDARADELGISVVVGFFKFIQWVLNEELSPEAVASIAYTQYFASGVTNYLIISQGESLQDLVPIRSQALLILQKAATLAQNPKKLFSIEFEFVMEGLAAIHSTYNFYLECLQHPDAKTFNLELAMKAFFDAWYSPNTVRLFTLLMNIRAHHKEVKQTKSSSKLLFNAPEIVYYDHILQILDMIDEMQTNKNIALAEETASIITKYDFVRPELFQVITEEYSNVLTSGLETFALITISRFLRYEFQWRLQGQELQKFCMNAFSVVQKMVEKIFQLEGVVTPAIKRLVETDPSLTKFVLLNLYSFMVTSTVALTLANEYTERELMDQFVKDLKIDSVLKYFEDLRAKINLKEQELTYQLVCYHFGFYLAALVGTQGSRILKNSEDLILTPQQFEKLFEFTIAFSYANPVYSDVLSQIPVTIGHIGSNRADYVRSLHTSGYIEYLCTHIYMNFNTRPIVNVDAEPDYRDFEMSDLNLLKRSLYEQMIEDKNYPQVVKVINAYKKSLLSNYQRLNTHLVRFQEIHDVEKYCTVSDFWGYCLDIKGFILMLDDLFEKSQTQGFEKEAEAKPLMKTLQESLLVVLEAFTNLPLVKKDSAIGKSIINLLNRIDAENQTACLKMIRNTVISRLNADNHRLIVSKYGANLQTSLKTNTEFKLSEFLIEVIHGETKPEDMMNYFELESLFSIFEFLDYNLSQKLTNKLKDEKLLSEDLQKLNTLWNVLHNDLDLLGKSGTDLQVVSNLVARHYIGFFDLCYDNAAEKLTKIMAENLEEALKKGKDVKLRETQLKELTATLFTATALAINLVRYYTMQTGALTREQAAVVRSLLCRKGFISLILESVAVLEELNRLAFEKAKAPSPILVVINQLKMFFEAFTQVRPLKEAYIRSLFLDVDTQAPMSKLMANFFEELLEGSTYLVRLNPEPRSSLRIKQSPQLPKS